MLVRSLRTRIKKSKIQNPEYSVLKILAKGRCVVSKDECRTAKIRTAAEFRQQAYLPSKEREELRP